MILILCMETALLYHLPDQKNRQLLDAILVVAGNLNQLRNNPILSYPIPWIFNYHLVSRLTLLNVKIVLPPSTRRDCIPITVPAPTQSCGYGPRAFADIRVPLKPSSKHSQFQGSSAGGIVTSQNYLLIHWCTTCHKTARNFNTYSLFNHNNQNVFFCRN